MAQNPGHPLAYRVHFAAIGWADRQGHAGFEPGRLATLLGKNGKPLSDQSTRNAVARAKELDLVSPRSGAACLVLPPHLFQKGKGAPVPLPTPSGPVSTRGTCSQSTSGAYRHGTRPAETFACSLIYLAPVQCGPCRGRMRKATRINGKERRGRGSAPQEQGNGEERSGRGGLPAATVSALNNSAAPEGADRSKPARPLGALPRPTVSAVRLCSLQAYAVVSESGQDGDQVIRPAVAVRGQERRTLKPWRNLGCQDMAVRLVMLRGSSPHPFAVDVLSRLGQRSSPLPWRTASAISRTRSRLMPVRCSTARG